MKKYRALADESAKAKLSHMGSTNEANAPQSVRQRGVTIDKFKDGFNRGGSIGAKIHGEKSAKRMDKFARGGGVKSKSGKTNITIVVAPGNGGAQQPPQVVAKPVPVPVPAGGPPAGGMPMRPPMGGAPGGMAPPPGAMPPPNMMPRKSGGRVVGAHGDVKSKVGSASGTGRLEKSGKSAKFASKDGVVNAI